jgi:hypothetical protein
MSARMAEPRDDGRQETLFDALAPPPRALRPAGPRTAPPKRDENAAREEATISFLRPREAGDTSAPGGDEHVALPDGPRDAAPVVDLRVSRQEAPTTDLTGPQAEAAVVFEREVAGERAPRVAGAPLAGPTLDDVMSRVWEGLVTGLPAACPVCHHEVVPVLGGPAGGRCTSCGTVID